MSNDSYRILAVDDLTDNLFLLQIILEAEGYKVDLATSATSALDKIATSPPDLLLLDVMMPDLSGFEVTQRIRQKQQLTDLPIVLITAHKEVSPRKVMEVGANDLIRKPIDTINLVSKVKSFLPIETNGSRR